MVLNKKLNKKSKFNKKANVIIFAFLLLFQFYSFFMIFDLIFNKKMGFLDAQITFIQNLFGFENFILSFNAKSFFILFLILFLGSALANIPLNSPTYKKKHPSTDQEEITNPFYVLLVPSLAPILFSPIILLLENTFIGNFLHLAFNLAFVSYIFVIIKAILIIRDTALFVEDVVDVFKDSESLIQHHV